MAVTFRAVIKRLTALLLPLLALLGAAPATSFAAATLQPTQRVIVQWRDAPAAPAYSRPFQSRFTDLRSRSGRKLSRGWDLGGSFSLLQLEQPQSGAELQATLAALRGDPAVAMAVADERVALHAYTPNDPVYNSQWYLQGAQPSAIRANQAWDITRGSPSVIVAVLDTGVRFDHPDLAGKLLAGWDFVSNYAMANDGDGWDNDPTDPGDFMTAQDLASAPFLDRGCGAGTNRDQPTTSSWHGTRVSGLIAANSDNGVGIAGSAFNVRVLPVRVLGKCGGAVSDVIAGMYWAAGMAPPPPYMSSPVPPVNTTPARVINMSLGNETPCSTSSSEVYRVAVEQITAHGVLIVASAGNSGAQVGSPAGCPGVLAVAGVRHAGTKVGYSSLGSEVGIAAPAGNCVNTSAFDPCLYALNTSTNFGVQGPTTNGYSSQTQQPTYGTSFSAPLAAGTAALMLSANNFLTPAQIVQMIKASARPFPTVSDTTPQPSACVSPAVTPVQNTECICSTAWCGAGMLDTNAAVHLAQNTPLPPPATPQDDVEPDEGGGGGGSTGGALLPLLLSLWLARRRVQRLTH